MIEKRERRFYISMYEDFAFLIKVICSFIGLGLLTLPMAFTINHPKVLPECYITFFVIGLIAGITQPIIFVGVLWCIFCHYMWLQIIANPKKYMFWDKEAQKEYEEEHDKYMEELYPRTRNGVTIYGNPDTYVERFLESETNAGIIWYMKNTNKKIDDKIREECREDAKRSLEKKLEIWGYDDWKRGKIK